MCSFFPWLAWAVAGWLRLEWQDVAFVTPARKAFSHLPLIGISPADWEFKCGQFDPRVVWCPLTCGGGHRKENNWTSKDPTQTQNQCTSCLKSFYSQDNAARAFGPQLKWCIVETRVEIKHKKVLGHEAENRSSNLSNLQVFFCALENKPEIVLQSTWAHSEHGFLVDMGSVEILIYSRNLESLCTFLWSKWKSLKAITVPGLREIMGHHHSAQLQSNDYCSALCAADNSKAFVDLTSP